MWLVSLALAAPFVVDASGPRFDIRVPGLVPDLDAPQPQPIINGDPATDEDWPMTGALVVKADVSVYGQQVTLATSICTATLIAPDTVLLAAHCIDELVLSVSLPSPKNIEFAFERNADMTVYSTTLKDDFRPAASRAVYAVPHPEFNVFSFNTNLGVARNNDIALLFLEEPLLDAPLGYVITADEADQVEEGREVEIVGWGQRSATNQYLSGQKYMGTSVINELGKWELQIGAKAEDVRKCHGDSGGPTFMTVDSESSVAYRVIGVTSHAYDLTDCDSKGGVDTRVDAFLDWIDATMQEGCAEDGWRSWCEVPGLVPPPDADGYDAWEENPNESDDGEDAASEEKGGCSTVPAPALWLLTLPALVGLRRRGR